MSSGFWSKYWLAAFVGYCIILAYLFFYEIAHQERIDLLMNKYYHDIEQIHKDRVQ